MIQRGNGVVPESFSFVCCNHLRFAGVWNRPTFSEGLYTLEGLPGTRGSIFAKLKYVHAVLLCYYVNPECNLKCQAMGGESFTIVIVGSYLLLQSTANVSVCLMYDGRELLCYTGDGLLDDCGDWCCRRRLLPSEHREISVPTQTSCNSSEAST